MRAALMCRLSVMTLGSWAGKKHGRVGFVLAVTKPKQTSENPAFVTKFH
jgi:hypothetical protein